MYKSIAYFCIKIKKKHSMLLNLNFKYTFIMTDKNKILTFIVKCIVKSIEFNKKCKVLLFNYTLYN